MPRIYTRTDPVIRFWSKVNKRGPDECWPWLGPKVNRFGHGAFHLGGRGGKQTVASRYSWELHNGPIPEGWYVCHRCDNPPCVNPAHLFAAPPKGNVHDMIAKGRAGYRKNKSHGSAHWKAKLTESDVRAIRDERATTKISIPALAKKYDVSVSTVEKILARASWAHA